MKKRGRVEDLLGYFRDPSLCQVVGLLAQKLWPKRPKSGAQQVIVEHGDTKDLDWRAGGDLLSRKKRRSTEREEGESEGKRVGKEKKEQDTTQRHAHSCIHSERPSSKVTKSDSQERRENENQEEDGESTASSQRG